MPGHAGRARRALRCVECPDSRFPCRHHCSGSLPIDTSASPARHSAEPGRRHPVAPIISPNSYSPEEPKACTAFTVAIRTPKEPPSARTAVVRYRLSRASRVGAKRRRTRLRLRSRPIPAADHLRPEVGRLRRLRHRGRRHRILLRSIQASAERASETTRARVSGTSRRRLEHRVHLRVSAGRRFRLRRADSAVLPQPGRLRRRPMVATTPCHPPRRVQRNRPSQASSAPLSA